jgi:phospholipid-binding lipoprotein MlaA
VTAAGGNGGWLARARSALLAALLAASAGCATTGNGDPRDPLEGFNRAMFAFNDGFDEAIGKPVATAYKTVLPDPLRGFVRNFFANLADLWIGANNMLQGKFLEGWTDWVRFAFNSTFGFLGINDLASEFGLEKHDEDFGQTFGRWGVGDGAYLVWPFLGSSTARDTLGLVFDIGLDPVRRHDPKDARYFMVGLRAVGRRADLLDASRILEEAALDKYIFQRDAYLQRRRSLINDGRPARAERELPRAAARPGPAAQAPEQAPPPGGLPAAGAAGNVFEPSIPRNYEAVLAASSGG